MTEFLTFNLLTAYNEIKGLAEQEGIITNEAWDSFVENWVNNKIRIGELDPDQDTQGIIEDLKAKWADYHKNLNIT